ncbi:acyl-CoA dehydrogenase family protein [Pseudonocardia yuanmonensis]|uniref:Acyl-CoA dehydrogenase family protein n=1 Tax=Pseudonocardia yuanmonensis TaxID=1095914 RepID=A0ABP8WSD7_9PSEU
MTVTDVEALRQGVEKIAPVLRENAPLGDRECRLPDASVNAMREVGLHRMWIPRSLGGLEIDPVSAFDLIEEIATIDAAAAWNLYMSVTPSLFAMWLPEEGAREMLVDADVRLAGSLFPPLTAVPVDGGYRVTGRAPFVSGCHAATWLGFAATITDDGVPRTTDEGEPVEVLVFLPRADGRIVDNWDVLGMRGTGSHDVALDDVLVPERRAALLAPFGEAPPGPAFQGPLYRMVFWQSTGVQAAVALGIARAAVAELVELAAVKTPAFTGTSLREHPQTQIAIGRAEAARCAARAFLREVLAEGYADCEAGRPFALEHRRAVQAASTHGVEAAATAVRLVHEVAGTSAIRNSRPFAAHFRDVHTITQHAFVSANRHRSVGQLMLGLPPEWPLFAF